MRVSFGFLCSEMYTLALFLFCYFFPQLQLLNWYLKTSPIDRFLMANQQTIIADIPDDIIFNNIFPCLPSKSLGQLKSVSKRWYNEIDQFFRHRFFTSGVIFIKDQRLAIFTTLEDRILILDPFLHFVSDPVNTICASTNGLICLRLEECLYVCNPLTREGHRIPDSRYRQFVGLMFEPSISPDQYKLVHPLKSSTFSRPSSELQFEVFSSSDGKWVTSDTVVIIPYYPRMGVKSVSAKGIVYWTWTKYLLWFDYDNDRAGYVVFPRKLTRNDEDDIGIWEDRVSCIRVGSGTMVIWVLAGIDSNNGRWDAMYQLPLPPKASLLANAPPCLLQERMWVNPLPFEGGEKVLLRVTGEDRQVRIVSWDLKTEKVNEVFKGPFIIGLITRPSYCYDNSCLVSLPPQRFC